MNLEELLATGISEDQANSILGLHDKGVQGLINKRDELLGMHASDKEAMSAQSLQLEQARQAAVTAEESKLLANGKYEEAQKLRESERAELIASAQEQTKKAKDALMQRDLGDVHSSILSSVSEHMRPAAQAMLNQNTTITYGEDGTINKSIRHGDKEFTDVSAFMEFAKTDNTWKSLLSAPNTQGVGASNNVSGKAGGANKAYGEMSMAEQIEYNSTH
jgi:hypothetical protein